MAGLTSILLVAIAILSLIHLVVSWSLIRAVKRHLYAPMMPPEPLPSKRVIMAPGGSFTVEERGRAPIYNDDATVWNRENNQ